MQKDFVSQYHESWTCTDPEVGVLTARFTNAVSSQATYRSSTIRIKLKLSLSAVSALTDWPGVLRMYLYSNFVCAGRVIFAVQRGYESLESLI